ncbi:AGE family epimerase/isomerase [Fibrella sp. HMF5335]|uniref:Cellobiose 2-epimerase n=1 Tax=Fibrella rubiginis TaxID=2817060 RepID=A0A939K2N8_9BACT|nr:AGE family epimerase/isomerase [Fibrella rubiginis]MBO0938407.1 AGE family epimerase/isomerase [Fibrella rubiginis]
MTGRTDTIAPALYRQQVEAELTNILTFWATHSLDNAHGGFIGRISGEGVPDPAAPKGGVLNARILWTFAAAYRHTKKPQYLVLADRAYDYLMAHFWDKKHGGVYWSVNADGTPRETHKQVYGQAFALYGLSEYYRATARPDALKAAKELYAWMEKYSFDGQRGGYYEATSREGAVLDRSALSANERNVVKTMNTHLHVLEAYANAYRIWPDAGLARQLRRLLQTFRQHILDPHTYHQRLFFTADWKPTADLVSYGHDIEAAWLLLEAAELLGDNMLIQEMKMVAVEMARSVGKTIEPDGSLLYELNRTTGHTDTHREWWVIAEAMVGFLNAWQLTGNKTFYEQSVRSWQFAQEYLLDKAGGEWRWGVFADHSPMVKNDKIGFWKCPYHNSRACLEVIERLGESR